MKKCLKHVVLLFMVVSVLCTSVSAAEYTNAYISSARAYIHKWAAGDISVEYTVTGTDIMDTIGAHMVLVFKALGSERDIAKDELVAKYWYEDYPDMMGSGTFLYSHSIRLKAEAGQRYYAVLVLYATLNGGGDDMAYSTKIVEA